MPCSNGRVIQLERLESAEPAHAFLNLRDIARINRWFGGHRTLIRTLRSLTLPNGRFTILDVGAASGDMGRCIRDRYPDAAVTSLDWRALHLRDAPGPRVAADAFHLPFPDRSFDLVLCSSVLHHFPDASVSLLLTELRRIPRRALIVLDLERHPVPYYFLPLTRRLLRWHNITVSDGRISVRAAFRAEELACLARESGVAAPSVRKHRPWFRLSLVVPA